MIVVMPQNAFDALIHAVAKSGLCVADTSLPHPSSCPQDCEKCYKDAAVSAAAVAAQESETKEGKTE